MKKREQIKLITRILIFIIIFCMCVPIIAYADEEDTSEKLEEINKEIDNVTGEITDLENNLNDAKDTQTKLESSKTDVEAYISKLNKQSSNLANQITEAENKIAAKINQIEKKQNEIIEKIEEIDAKQLEIDDKKKEISNTITEIQITATDIEKQYEAMNLRVQFMYENTSNFQYLELLFQSKSIFDFLNKIDYMHELIDYDMRMRNKLIETKQDLEELERNLTAQKNELVDQQIKLNEQKTILEEEKQTLETEKSELDALKKELEKKKKNVAKEQNNSAKQLQEYINNIIANSEDIKNYEDTIKAKQDYYEKLLDEKKKEEEEIARRKAEEEAKNTGGNIAEGDSGISGDFHYDITDEELTLLASIIYCESGGEPYEGQLAVGYVIMNRVRSNKFPNTITGVVYQKNQFSPVGSGRLAVILAMENDPDIKGKVTKSCYNAAREVLTGTSNVSVSLFFRTWRPVPQLIENLEANGVPYYIIGGHIFYHTYTKY